MAVVKFSKQTIEPNPLEVDYWVDITSDPYGSVWKYYNGTDWVSLNLNDGSDNGLSSFDYYTKEQIDEIVDSIEGTGEQVVVTAMTPEDILAAIGMAGEGVPVNPSGQILTEMSAQDVQDIIKR